MKCITMKSESQRSIFKSVILSLGPMYLLQNPLLKGARFLQHVKYPVNQIEPQGPMRGLEDLGRVFVQHLHPQFYHLQKCRAIAKISENVQDVFCASGFQSSIFCVFSLYCVVCHGRETQHHLLVPPKITYTKHNDLTTTGQRG